MLQLFTNTGIETVMMKILHIHTCATWETACMIYFVAEVTDTFCFNTTLRIILKLVSKII